MDLDVRPFLEMPVVTKHDFVIGRTGVEYSSLQFVSDEKATSIAFPKTIEKDVVDKICLVSMGTSFSELKDKLADSEQQLSEVECELDEVRARACELEQIIDDMNASSNFDDYSDDHELY